MTDETKQKLDLRRQFVNQQLERLKRETASYESELAELDVAERVYQRIHGPLTVGGAARNQPEPEVKVTVQTSQEINRDENEPDESGPTLPNMVFLILDEAKAEGRKGVDSSEMLKIIQQRWKPDFTPDRVRPTLWRMVKRKRLKKRGRLYSRIEEATNDPAQGQLDVVRH